MERSESPASPIDRAALIRLDRRGDAAGLVRLAGHGAALLGSGALVLGSTQSLLLAPALVLHGFLLIFLFAPLHETIHRTAFRSRWLNDVVAFVTGAILVLPPEHFRRFHFAHHRHTQDPARDPELAVPKPASRAAWLWHVSGIPYWLAAFRTLARQAAGRVDEPYAPAHGRGRIVAEARILWALYGGTAILAAVFASPLPLLLWVGPALLGQPFLRLFLLAEHTGCAATPDMLANSRTTRTTALLRYVAWNMPFHAEHHACPSVPFHALPALHRILAHRLGCRGTGYVAAQRGLLATLGSARGR